MRVATLSKFDATSCASCLRTLVVSWRLSLQSSDCDARGVSSTNRELVLRGEFVLSLTVGLGKYVQMCRSRRRAHDSRSSRDCRGPGPQSPQCLYVCSLFATKLPIRSDVNLTQIQTHSSRRRFDCSACQIWSLFQERDPVGFLSYYYLIPSRTRGRGVQGKPGAGSPYSLLSPAWYSTISFICEVALPSFGPP